MARLRLCDGEKGETGGCWTARPSNGSGSAGRGSPTFWRLACSIGLGLRTDLRYLGHKRERLRLGRLLLMDVLVRGGRRRDAQRKPVTYPRAGLLKKGTGWLDLGYRSQRLSSPAMLPAPPQLR